MSEGISEAVAIELRDKGPHVHFVVDVHVYFVRGFQ